MILSKSLLEKVKSGEVKMAFRKWKECRIKEGSRFRTSLGVLRILKIKEIAEESLTEEKALEAGYDSLDELLSDLNKWGAGNVYRIHLKFEDEGPRIKATLSKKEKEELMLYMEQMDKDSLKGPWVMRFLELIDKYPGVGGIHLHKKTAFNQRSFTRYVRKLKSLGLTISLGTGYRLSERGQSFLKILKATD